MNLLRLPLLGSGENRERLAPGELYPEIVTCGECLRRPVLDGDLKHVVYLAGHWLLGLDQDLLKGRDQIVGGLVWCVGHAEREELGR